VPERVPQDRIGFAQAEGVIVAALAELRELLSADAHARYKQVVDLAGGAPTFALLMDRRRYAALPEAARKALDGAGGVAFARRYGAAMAADDRAALAELTRGGKRTVVVLSDADRAEWDKASEKAQRAWAAKHPNGKALLDAALGAR
jgi:TRAP-type C4-dicarboxylate transport system substrate-binding protein